MKTRRIVFLDGLFLWVVQSLKQENPTPQETQSPTTIYVEGFIQPLLVEDVKALVSRIVAPLDMEQHFFMNMAKTYCFVTYPSQKEAMKALKNMYECCIRNKSRIEKEASFLRDLEMS